jgi:hypothetical protein
MFVNGPHKTIILIEIENALGKPRKTWATQLNHGVSKKELPFANTT